MSNHLRSARRKRARRRPTRQPLFDPMIGEIGEIHTFTVGNRSIDSVVIDLDQGPESAELDHDCPYCQAIATLQEFEAAEGRATPELEQRAKEAMLLLSGGAESQ
jgi:hypothetical protein